jgi:hypothetical protein
MKLLNRLTIAVVMTLGTSSLAQEETGGNRLEEVVREMKVASDHLAKRSTDTPPQTAQKNAVDKLDTLIAELEKERTALGQGVSPNPTIPAMDSTIRTGPGGMGDLHGVRSEGDRWGELPAHERDRILQSLTEGFPPHYQAVLEAYYKRLAVEKRAENQESPAASKPAAPAKTTASGGRTTSAPATTKMATPVKKTDK